MSKDKVISETGYSETELIYLGLVSIKNIMKNSRDNAPNETLRNHYQAMYKAYDRLEEEGLTSTVHGKGTYVTGSNKEMIAEMQRREIEDDMEKVVNKARNNGIKDEELREILDLLLGE